MQITIGLWIIPAILTGICLFQMFRKQDGSDQFGIGALFSMLWIIPILFIWSVYFGILLLLK
jgi:hypothetical protein